MSRKNPFYNDRAKTIVNIISHYPILYDKKHYDYKNKNRKMAVWKEICNYIAREMPVNLTASKLEKRWLGWKCTFISEHKRLHTPPIDMNVKKWYLYKAMMFMEPYISHHRKSLKEEESFGQDEIPPKPEYNEHLVKPLLTPLLTPMLTRYSTGHVHKQSSSFSCSLDDFHLSQGGVGKSELADSTSTLSVSQVIGNYSNHGMLLPVDYNQSRGQVNDPINRKPVCPDSSGLATGSSPATSSFFKEEGKDKCRCIIEERLERIPLERRTMCLIEIFQVIHKYENSNL